MRRRRRMRRREKRRRRRGQGRRRRGRKAGGGREGRRIDDTEHGLCGWGGRGVHWNISGYNHVETVQHLDL